MKEKVDTGGDFGYSLPCSTVRRHEARNVDCGERMSEYNMKWTRGNEKLQKDNGGTYNIIGFGIPADHDFIDDKLMNRNTCPGALACKAVCYAKQGRYAMPNVRGARIRNLEMTLQDNFAEKVIADLGRMRKVNTVRIHDSGDFYSQEYLDKWIRVAKSLPYITFYAYTKNLQLDMNGLPDNFRITQSLGGRWDENVDRSRSHSRIFATHYDRVRAGYIDGNVNDVPAIEGLVRIGLVYHGQRNLTESQKRHFS